MFVWELEWCGELVDTGEAELSEDESEDSSPKMIYVLDWEMTNQVFRWLVLNKNDQSVAIENRTT